ncbi:MAG: hypothetical protein EZS28_031610, partial [Streblomastix strix]
MLNSIFLLNSRGDSLFCRNFRNEDKAQPE